jgi:hypothetical protein
MNFLIDNFWLTGYFINATVFFGLMTHFVFVAKEVGIKQVKAMVDARDYTISKWAFVTWLVPYVGVYSLVRFVYLWNRIDADSLLERLTKFEQVNLSYIMRKLFVRKKEIVQSNANIDANDVVHSSDAL